VAKERALGEIWGSRGFDFKDMKPCNLEDTCRSFRRTWCLSGSSERSLLVYHFFLTMDVADSSAISVDIYRDADKSLARPGRKQTWKHVRDVRDFNTSRRKLSSSFFFPLQGKAPKEIHAILTETLACFLPGRAKDSLASLEQECMPSPRANIWMKNQKFIAVCVGRKYFSLGICYWHSWLLFIRSSEGIYFWVWKIRDESSALTSGLIINRKMVDADPEI